MGIACCDVRVRQTWAVIGQVPRVGDRPRLPARPDVARRCALGPFLSLVRTHSGATGIPEPLDASAAVPENQNSARMAQIGSGTHRWRRALRGAGTVDSRSGRPLAGLPSSPTMCKGRSCWGAPTWVCDTAPSISVLRPSWPGRLPQPRGRQSLGDYRLDCACGCSGNFHRHACPIIGARQPGGNGKEKEAGFQ